MLLPSTSQLYQYRFTRRQPHRTFINSTLVTDTPVYSYSRLVYQQWGADSESVISIQWGIYSAVLLIIILSAHPKISNVKHIFTELNDENHKYGLQLYIGSLFMVASNYLAGITLGVFNEDNTEVGSTL